MPSFQDMEKVYLAAKKGDGELVKKLAIDVNSKDEYTGYTALTWAFHQRQLELASLGESAGLLDLGKEELTKRREKIEEDTKHTIEVLLASGANPNIRNKDGLAPIHLAAANMSEAMLARMVKHGADVNLGTVAPEGFEGISETGRTALHFASRRSDGLIKGVTMLLDSGAKVDATDSKGDTPLHAAARTGNAAVVDLLVKNGASIDARNGAGQTPLLLTGHSLNDESMHLLLKAGANPNVKDADDATLLHAIAGAIETASNNPTVKADMLKKAIGAGVDVNAVTNAPSYLQQFERNETALHKLFSRSHKAGNSESEGRVAVKVLIEAGIDINAKNNHGKTASDVAKEHGWPADTLVSQSKTTEKVRQPDKKISSIVDPTQFPDLAVADAGKGGANSGKLSPDGKAAGGGERQRKV